MCDTYYCDYLPHTTFRFYFINFQLNTNYPSQFCFIFTVKSPSVTQRSVSQENALKRAKNSRLFSQNYMLKWFFYSNWTQFQVFKIAKFEFKVTVHYSLCAKCTQLWPLNSSRLWRLFFVSLVGANLLLLFLLFCFASLSRNKTKTKETNKNKKNLQAPPLDIRWCALKTGTSYYKRIWYPLVSSETTSPTTVLVIKRENISKVRSGSVDRCT